MTSLFSFLAVFSLALYYLIAIGISIRIVIKRRVVGVSMAWLMVIYSVPFAGVAAYLMFGELNLGRKRAERARQMLKPYQDWFKQLNHCQAHHPSAANDAVKPLHHLCENQLGIPSLSGNQLQLFSTPDTIMQALIDDIDNAEHSIALEFYIWHPGGMANDVGLALIQAAKRGVDIKILLDSAGSQHFFRSEWPDALRDQGIDVIEALSVSAWRMFLRRMDLRQHRKIAVFDNRVAYTGSMNMVDPAFFKTNAGVGQWVDIMTRITGPSASTLHAIHAWDWEVETGDRLLPLPPDCPCRDDNVNAGTIQTIPSGPGMPPQIIHDVLSLAIYQAKESITITTPYFVPSEALHHALLNAAQRGVTVSIILPKDNDSTMVKWASRSFFHELMRAGVNIHLFKGGLLHTKSVVVDKSYCLIGTVNLDMRSLWLNFEVTVAIDESHFINQLVKLHADYVTQSESVEPSRWRNRTVKARALEHFFYLFSPLL